MGQKEAGRPSRLRGVHACVHWCGVGGLSLQEHAAQPGSLGLGEVSGIRILSVPRSPWHCDWEDEGRLWEGATAWKSCPRSFAALSQCPLDSPSIRGTFTRCAGHKHLYGTATRPAVQCRMGALVVHWLGSHPCSATDLTSPSPRVPHLKNRNNPITYTTDWL